MVQSVKKNKNKNKKNKQKKHLPRQDTWVQSLGQEEPLEEEMATHSSILAWKIPWAGEVGGYRLRGRRVRLSK